MNKKHNRSTAFFFVVVAAFNWNPCSGAPLIGNAFGLETNSSRL
ncbi:MAG TPA: hypothetical protein PL001_04175 [Candidatus Kryptobacter bacterium]|nr:hypothetical protein [Candidatus Kryptobacter bacterium]